MSSWRLRWILVRMHLAVCWHGTDASWVASAVPRQPGQAQRDAVQRRALNRRDGLH